MNATILFRIGSRFSEEEEYRIAQNYFRVETSRCLCENTVVIGRYSTLPFYEDLEQDLKYNSSRLINSYDQHRWIANFDYYNDLSEYTFESWKERDFPSSKHPGPFVVKGTTNSKKHHWNTMMFAKDRNEAVEVASRLYQDDLVGRQGLVYRKYEPLVTYEVGLNGLAFTNEWRLFFLGENLISYGYYWSEAQDVDSPHLSEEAIAFAHEVAKIASKHTNFFTLDIGEKQSGGWVLIEVNDGQQSGLSMNNTEDFYRNLAQISADFNLR